MSPVTGSTLLFVRRQDEYAPCADYVVRLFARLFQLKLFIRDFQSAQTVPMTPRFIVEYSGEVDAASIVKSQFAKSAILRIPRSSFFGIQYLSNFALPEPESLLSSTLSDTYYRSLPPAERANECELGFDLIASCFWFLTRYEEYNPDARRDLHGRFNIHSSAAALSFYDKPVANIWFEHLGQLLLRLENPAVVPVRLSAARRICLTHDVDVLRAYPTWRSVLGAYTRRRGGGFAGVWNGVQVRMGRRADPFDTFEEMFDLKERLGIASTWFLMAGKHNRLDASYSLHHPRIREILARGRRSRDEFAVHPSYESGRSEEFLRAERNTLSAAVNNTVRGSRQHYLRAVLPDTLRHLETIGLDYDSSLGFAGYAGFRCGWSGPMTTFDVESKKELSLIEIPLHFMDITLADYEKVSGERAVERIASVCDASDVRGGAFVALIHNTILDNVRYPGHWGAFQYFLNAAYGGTRFPTLSVLVDEFRKTDQYVAAES